MGARALHFIYGWNKIDVTLLEPRNKHFEQVEHILGLYTDALSRCLQLPGVGFDLK